MAVEFKIPGFLRPRQAASAGWPLHSETFSWVGATVPEPDRRKRSTPVGAAGSIKFKTLDDARDCRIEVDQNVGLGGVALTLQPAGETREVRLLMPLNLSKALAGLPGDAVASFQVSVRLAGAEHSLPLQWVAVLSRGADANLHIWRRLAQGVDPRPEGLRRWSFATGGPDEETPSELFLAVQLAPGCGPVSMSAFEVRSESVATADAAFTLGSPDNLDGWLRSPDGGRDAEILATAPGHPPVALKLADSGGLFTLTRKAELLRFTAPREALFLALGDDRVDWSLVLTDEGRAVAQAQLPHDTAINARVAAPAAPKARGASEAMTPPLLAAMELEPLVEALSGHYSASLAREVPRLLYNQKAVEKLWGLHSRLVKAAEPETAQRWAYLDYFFGRIMLEMNAARTAFDTFSRMVATPAILAQLNPTDARRARHLLARACLRTGLVDEAVDRLTELSIDDPTDWESYFQLGAIVSPADPERGALYFRLAEELATKLPTSSRLILIDALLSQGRNEDALLKTLAAMKADRSARELQLCLANTYKALGRHAEWARCLDVFFGFYDLAPPGEALATGRVEVAPAPEPADETGPRVTVVMTTFNSEATVELAVRSVLAQTYGNLRLVVVDDVSSDRTCEVIAAIAAADPRVSLMVQERNGGTYQAKNRALKEVGSDYFTFHDSDDWMHPERIAEHVRLMESDPTLVCSTSLWYRVDEAGYAIVRRAGHILHENPASTFFRASVLDEIGFFDSVRAGADSEFLWRIRRRFGPQATAELPKPLAVGLHHAASITQSGAAAFDQHRFSAVRLAYWESWVDWHRRATVEGGRTLFVDFPQTDRPFIAPEGLLTVG